MAKGRGFAYLWLPGRYLARPGADVVLSVVLGRRDDDPRRKEVVHPAPARWMHHLEVHDAAEIDAQVARPAGGGLRPRRLTCGPGRAVRRRSPGP